ncbi:MAG: 2-octaprenyl-6-methoxyphenyl hydroxylase [Gammaproteobacteria bacterium]|nr:2-octaprenyl-6-methoxyphenyl hydroxylase [Gammaproteobacteria bacterium]
MGEQTQADCDVAIVGGGLAGASLAVGLLPLPLRVALIEATPPGGAPDRALGLNDATRRILESFGVWDAIEPDAEPIRATHISERGRFGVARFTAEEAGLPALGYNTPMRAIAAALFARLKDAPRFAVFAPAELKSLQVEADRALLRIEPRGAAAGPGISLKARLVVAADGAQSAVRGMLGIGTRAHDYRQTAIVCDVQPERPHAGVAYERFAPEGPIAVLPRRGDVCGIVWTVATERAAEIRAWDDARFLSGFHAAFGHRLGRFLRATPRQAFPLHAVLSERLTSPRVIFAGNAAQTLHPVAAQGFNLGLRDVATVAELLASARDPGAPELLQAYEERRAADRARIAEFTDRLVRTFSNDLPGLRGARHLGLLALDLLPTVKAAVMRQNLGYAGATPGPARGLRTA